MEDEEKQDGDTGMVLSGSIAWPASTVLQEVLKSLATEKAAHLTSQVRRLSPGETSGSPGSRASSFGPQTHQCLRKRPLVPLGPGQLAGG